MIIFDFFAGTRSSTQAFEDAGHTVISFDNDPQFDVTVQADIMSLTGEGLMQRFGQPDFIWASPPCTAFSVASMGHHWISGGEDPQPRTYEASFNQELVWKTRAIIDALKPRYGYLIENPRGMLRKLPPVKDLPRHTVTYCQYGDDRMKPTDLWGYVPLWNPRPPCKNGADCHVAAPRGSRTGTQGREGAVSRSMVPYELGAEILRAIEGATW